MPREGPEPESLLRGALNGGIGGEFRFGTGKSCSREEKAMFIKRISNWIPVKCGYDQHCFSKLTLESGISTDESSTIQLLFIAHTISVSTATCL